MQSLEMPQRAVLPLMVASIVVESYTVVKVFDVNA
jgi:hypothetical protein